MSGCAGRGGEEQKEKRGGAREEEESNREEGGGVMFVRLWLVCVCVCEFERGRRNACFLRVFVFLEEGGDAMCV